jgi:3-deoxy-manno-octulosonate cytidylyltransferase (CMP-KDO synthetase)
MTATVIIPARMSSTRLPGKPLLDIAGRPMVIRVWERLRRMRGVDAVVIATPDDEVARAARAFGADAVMTSADCRTGTDRVAEAARKMHADVVVNVQGDEPLVEPAHVLAAIRALQSSNGAGMATLKGPLTTLDELNDHNVVKVVTDARGRALYFSRSPIPSVSSGRYVMLPTGPKDPVGRHVGIYAFKRRFLWAFAALPRTPLERAESLEQLRALEHGHEIRVGHVGHASTNVDSPEDLERVRAIYRSGRTGGGR